MGSEVEVIDDMIDEFNDAENTIFVAVGKNVKESKSLILWALQSFAGMKICLLHIHQPAQSVTLLYDRFAMHKILNQYSLILSQAGVQAGKVWIEADKVEIGIVQTIAQHGIRWLVMGAASDSLYSTDMLELKSSKALYVCQQAPSSCQIWFACKGHLIYTRRNGSTLPSFQDELVRSLSAIFLEGPQGLSSSDLHDRLVCATKDAENAKQIAFEESIKRWKAEEDVKEDLHEAEASENLLMEEIKQIKETEFTLARIIQEVKMMKNQRDQCIEEFETVQDQKSGLVDRISKTHGTEKELDERILQAVNLLIIFKEQRDNLQDELGNARRQINRLATYVNEENTKFSQAEFYKPSFMEIMEATQDFNQSLKIGEGRCGSVYKGILRHVRVAIKMLPSLGSQGDAEFEHEAEGLSKIRHPNLVTLMGVCPETRSLIYEYLENGSLEEQIASHGTAPTLQWHTRLRIASEICSALIFLHASKPQIIHGNLKVTNILLDSNHVCKLSGLGINHLIFSKASTSVYNDLEPEASAYMDPEVLESGNVSASSDVYSFGVVLLRLITGRPASSIITDTKCALENGSFGTILDSSGGDWPIEDTKELAYLGMRCCGKNPMDRPDLVDDILPALEKVRHLSTASPVESESENHRRVPSYFVCPIYQEVMKDPYIAADGFTYEADAIKGWLNSGHKTSPMTNLKLEHCDLLPNHALSYAIQEWQQQF